jgi:hypothetical protein
LKIEEQDDERKEKLQRKQKGEEMRWIKKKELK